MDAIVLNLSKPGEAAPAIQLDLRKHETFAVKLAWSGQADLDLHALVCVNRGNGAKLQQAGDILSTYNVKRSIGGTTVGHIDPNADGSFAIHNGALIHSPDARNGDASAIDEFVKVDPSKLVLPADGFIEVPLLAMIHPQSQNSTFANVQEAQVTIENSEGKVLMTARLGNDFPAACGVQMGTLMIDSNGAKFAPVGAGFTVDFNGVINAFC